MNFLERIAFNPELCGARLCIRGMRIRVKGALSLPAAGVSGHEILEGYSDVEDEEIKACLHYAAALSRPCRASGGVKFILVARLSPALASDLRKRWVAGPSPHATSGLRDATDGGVARRCRYGQAQPVTAWSRVGNRSHAAPPGRVMPLVADHPAAHRKGGNRLSAVA